MDPKELKTNEEGHVVDAETGDIIVDEEGYAMTPEQFVAWKDNEPDTTASDKKEVSKMSDETLRAYVVNELNSMRIKLEVLEKRIRRKRAK